jgi:HSP20 family protein
MSRKTESKGEVTSPRRGFWDLDWPDLGEWPRFGRLERLLRAFDEGEGAGARARMLSPAVDIHEDERHYTIRVELPGVSADDVHVEVAEGVLSIRGEKRSERDEEKERVRYTERYHGSFQRTFRLPDDANPDAVEAAFKDGVLTISVARREVAKPKTVAIRK